MPPSVPSVKKRVLRTGNAACMLLALALLAVIPEARAKTPGRTVANGRLVLGNSIKEVAADAPSARRRQAAVRRTTLDAAELNASVVFEVTLRMRGLADLRARQAAGEKVAPATLEAKIPAGEVGLPGGGEVAGRPGFHHRAARRAPPGAVRLRHEGAGAEGVPDPVRAGGLQGEGFPRGGHRA